MTDVELPRSELESVFGADGPASVEQIHEPVAGASIGVWRVRVGDQSAVLKLIGHGARAHPKWSSGTDTAHWYYWRREVDAYESGLLESLPGGLRAPACKLVASRPDGTIALWLEDVTAAPAAGWSLDRYEMAARHLGQMQGAFVTTTPLPAYEWLSRDWLRSYVAQRDGDMHLADNDVRAMRADQPRFLAALDALPRTLCHLDLHPGNLLGEATGPTIGIDWSFVGIGAIGEDAGNLVPDAVLDFFVDPAHLDELYERIATGYLAGLRDAGWHGDDRLPRLGMAVTIGAKYAWIPPAMTRAEADQPTLLNRRPLAETLRWWAPVVPFIVERANEARALLRP